MNLWRPRLIISEGPQASWSGLSQCLGNANVQDENDNPPVSMKWLSVHKYFLYIFTTVYIFIGNFIKVFLGYVHFILYGKCMIPLVGIYVSTNHWVAGLGCSCLSSVSIHFMHELTAPGVPLCYSCWNIRVIAEGRKASTIPPRWDGSHSASNYTVYWNIKYYRQVLLLCSLWLMLIILCKLAPIFLCGWEVEGLSISFLCTEGGFAQKS